MLVVDLQLLLADLHSWHRCSRTIDVPPSLPSHEPSCPAGKRPEIAITRSNYRQPEREGSQSSMGSGRRAIFLAMASRTCPAPCPSRSLDWAQTAWYMASRQASMAPLSGSPRRSRPEICSGDQCASSSSRTARRGPGSSALRGVGRDSGLWRGPAAVAYDDPVNPRVYDTAIGRAV